MCNPCVNPNAARRLLSAVLSLQRLHNSRRKPFHACGHRYGSEGGGGFRERPVGMAYPPTNMAAQKCGENYFLEVKNDRWDGSI